MKQRLTYLILLLLNAVCVMAQTTVSGIVKDKREPLAGANVFILGTIDGCLTDSAGHFSFTTMQKGEVTLKATFVGFDDYVLTADVNGLCNHTVVMHEKATTIDEVVVTASTYSFGKSDNFKTMDALDVVMTGSSCGDIVAALQTLRVRRRWAKTENSTCVAERVRNARRLSTGCTCLSPTVRMWRDRHSADVSHPFSSKG